MAEKERMWAVVSDNIGTINDRKKTKDRIKQQRKGKIQPYVRVEVYLTDGDNKLILILLSVHNIHNTCNT